jgi:hypothetical protein
MAGKSSTSPFSSNPGPALRRPSFVLFRPLNAGNSVSTSASGRTNMVMSGKNAASIIPFTCSWVFTLSL